MNRLAGAAIALTIGLAGPAFANDIAVPCISNDGTPGNCTFATGASPMPVPSVPTTPASPGQFGLAITSSTALTVPSLSTYAVICARGGNANWTIDGTTTPTGTVGTQLLQNQCVGLLGATTLSNFRAIQQTGNTATLDVEYWKP